MRKEFKISSRPDGNRMWVDLMGEFDGGSAFELLNFLQKNCREFENFSIQTDNLQTIHSFGQTIIDRNLPHLLAKRKLQIRFDGGKKVSEVECFQSDE